MHFSGLASKIVDVNGNVISIQQTTSTINVTDSLQRVVTFNRDTNGFVTSVSFKDSNGVPQNISLSNGPIVGSATFQQPSVVQGSITQGLATITLPNNQTYRFEYNAYGELKKITYPTGGYTRYDYARYTNRWVIPSPVGSVPADFRQVSATHVCRQPSGACIYIR